MGIIISTVRLVGREWIEGLFSSFRDPGFPTLYGSNKTPVTQDVLEVGFIYAFVIVAFSFFIILPGIRGWERLYCFVRITCSLIVGAIIMLSLWGNGWETGEIHTKTQYRAFTGYEITATVGLKIGLHNMNITLVGDPIEQSIGETNETINYNERFWWSFPWSQGRNGFGRFAGEIQQEFREAQYKGLPYPILWVAEYFIFDGEGIRWGRHYRHAGFYTHIMLWTAFPLWIISNILFFMVPRHGSYFLFMTGFCMVTGNVIYATLRNPNDLQVPFEDGNLILSWGPNFWATLIAGLACMTVAILIFFMNECGYSSEIATFFGTDELQDYDEYYADAKEQKDTKSIEKLNKGSTSSEDNLVENETSAEELTEESLYENPTVGEQVAHYRKRESAFGSRFSKFKKSHKKKPLPVPRNIQDSGVIREENEEEDQEYENVPAGARRENSNGVHEEQVNIKMRPLPPKRDVVA